MNSLIIHLSNLKSDRSKPITYSFQCVLVAQWCNNLRRLAYLTPSSYLLKHCSIVAFGTNWTSCRQIWTSSNAAFGKCYFAPLNTEMTITPSWSWPHVKRTFLPRPTYTVSVLLQKQMIVWIAFHTESWTLRIHSSSHNLNCVFIHRNSELWIKLELLSRSVHY